MERAIPGTYCLGANCWFY